MGDVHAIDEARRGGNDGEAADETALVVRQRTSGITRLVLNDPPANALSAAMMDALLQAISAAESDEDCRVVVIAAQGNIFSAGHDLEALTAHRDDADGGRAFFEASARRCSDLMLRIARLRQPVIAEVNGMATGAGCQLVASCDLAIASEVGQFCMPGIQMGLFDSSPMVALSRNLSRKNAMEMLLTGEAIDARTAREFGLVNRVVPPEYLGTVVGKYATTIAAKSPEMVSAGKRAFHRQAEMAESEAYDHTNAVMTESFMSSRAETDIGAFLARRQAARQSE